MPMTAAAPALHRGAAMPSRRPAPGRRPARLLPVARLGRLPAACACGGDCPRCHAAGERALPIGEPGDVVERQADAAAAVMARQDPDAGGPASAAQTGRRHAPAIVDAVLRSPGRPLDPAIRTFMEGRFAQDFAAVRIHVDARAAESARAIGALAYTVGRDIVFAAAQFAPATPAGRWLLAHELAHVAQQDAGPPAVRRACRSKADCAGPNPGDPGRFGERIKAKQDEIRSRVEGASTGTPDAALNARNRAPAANVRRLAADAGITVPPQVFGFFVNAFLGDTVGAQTNDCDTFPGGAPAGAPAGKTCVQIPAAMEDEAGELLAAPSSTTPARRADLLLHLSTVVHELQHVRFDETQVKSIAGAADCTPGTVVFHGPHAGDFTVAFYLSEMSAIIAEFPLFFQNVQRSNTELDQNLLWGEERSMALNKDEGLRGIIQALQCACACDTADSLIAQTVDVTTAGWPAPQKTKFLQAMTRIMPSWWPQRLRRK